jgi:histone acetyltransferase (RNA polymerase elongator complex component)
MSCYRIPTEKADFFMTAPRIIPIFLPYQGCRQRCIFCNEKIATGLSPAEMSEETVQKTVALYSAQPKPKNSPVQIAFYGGTFTGMAEQEQVRLLRMVQPFLQSGQVDSLRISTRPDEIDEDRLDLLRRHGVKTVEIGAQSLVEDVLWRSRRCHTVDDVFSSVERLRRKGFEVGIHLMAGLPGDSPQSFVTTIERALLLQPDTVRLHPTLVFRDTVLETLYAKGQYSPLSLDEAVRQSRYALLSLEKAGIPVIRIGLQTSPEMECPGNIVAGPFHPAFHSLVSATIFREMASVLLADTSTGEGTASFLLSSRDVSDFRGHKNENISFLAEGFRPKAIRISGEPDYPRGWLTLHSGGRTISLHRTGLCPVLS